MYKILHRIKYFFHFIIFYASLTCLSEWIYNFFKLIPSIWFVFWYMMQNSGHFLGLWCIDFAIFCRSVWFIGINFPVWVRLYHELLVLLLPVLRIRLKILYNERASILLTCILQTHVTRTLNGQNDENLY